MNRTDRLYALVEELRAVAPRPRSARALAKRYEVSMRTIERDILALQEAGVPIYAEQGRLGGYVIDQAVTLPPLNFTAAEMVAIAVSLARHEGTPFAAATRSALRKVLTVASAAQTAEARQLMTRIRLIDPDRGAHRVPRPRAAAEDGGAASGRSSEQAARDRAMTVPLAIQEAISARHVLSIEYRDRRDTVTAREVEPVAFIGSHTQWYLLAWCRLRDEARVFRIDRILSASDTGEPVPPRSDLDTDIPGMLMRSPQLTG